MQGYFRSPKSIPLIVALLTVLGYGLLAARTGFYWDDWGFAWAAKFLGPASFIESFRGFRPFLGPIFFVTTSLVPPVPLLWQILALLVRFCIGLCAWWALRSFWPERPRLALGAALLLLVFPGYSQHWVAFTHINQELIPFIAYLLSFGASAHAIRRKSLPLSALALFLQFWGLFPTEYFFGLEPLRLLLIWSMIEDEPFLRRLRQAALRWTPYLLLWLADAVWLVFLYRSDTYISYGIQTQQGMHLLAWLQGLGEAILKAGFIAWGQILVLFGESMRAPTTLLGIAVALLTFVLLILYLPRLDLSGGEKPAALFAIFAGLAGIVLGRLPSLAAGLPLTMQSVFDRFMISMALGAALLAAGLIQLLAGRRERFYWGMISVLVALGVAQQFYNANIFRRDWARQQEIFQQMAARIPALKPGTLVLTDVIPDLPLETDLSFTAPLNWIYAPDYRGGDLPYALLYTEARLGGGALNDLNQESKVTLPFRTVRFQGGTDSALVILVPQRGCLRVLDPALGDLQAYEKESSYLQAAIPYSDPSRILTEEEVRALPNPPFPSATAQGWCRFYEQAELERQRQDWPRILELEAEASAHTYTPQDVFEWLPFIEANARSGDMQRAIQLTHESLKASARVRKGLCNLWDRVSKSVPDRADEAAHMWAELGCTP